MKRQPGSRAVDPGDADSSKFYGSMEDAAETTLIRKVEDRARNTSTGSDGFRAAVDGERVPLGIDNLGRAFGDENDPKAKNVEANPGPKRSFVKMANKVRALQKLARHKRQMSDKSLNSVPEDNGITHRRAQTLLASIDESNDNDEIAVQAGELFGFRQQVDESHDIDDVWEKLDTSFDINLVGSTASSSLEAPLLGSDRGSATASTSVEEGQPLLVPDAQSTDGRISPVRITRTHKIKNQWKKCAECLNPLTLFQRFLDWMSRSFLLLAFPFWIIAWVLYYHLGNPAFDFLPGTATLSWWSNFFGRHLLLLEIARTIQYLVVDCLALSTRLVTTILGPWVTIFCLQSRGWPFLVGGWGILAMILLHGDNAFQVHWLHMTGIRIYSSANSGSYILGTDTYLRVLIGMALTGLATSLKRTTVTLYFGRRNFEMYKPKLEDILNDIILITEVAELAAEADNLEDEDSESVNKSQIVEANLKKRGVLSEVRWSSVRFKKAGSSRPRLESEDSDQNLQKEQEPATTTQQPAAPNDKHRPNEKQIVRSLSKDVSSRRMKIKNLLDRWDEPVNKLDKTEDSTVNDILKFRRALTYMDLEHPFSVAFGPASSRDELIKSAENVYARLLKLAPGSTILPYSVLAVLSENEDGTIDKEKKRSLRTLYRPDVDEEVTLLAFIQSCDTVYKRLRYFRASVGNSSVIDKVLESIINSAFYFIIGLMILSLLHLNPWPLLVSMSTLLVTFAFALGPSAAKAIEGILLIVGRRPFDIGDRIIVSDSPGGAVPGVGMSWLVEDITLFSTTLRFAATNEVATLSNGSIAAARISNCARSKNALIHLVLKLHIKVHEGRNVELMREALENYVADNANVWESIVIFRCEEIDSDCEFVMYRLAIRSRHSWQVSARVLNDRAKLHQFTIGLAKKLDVAFDSPDARRVLYYGGSLVDGAVRDYKKDLLHNHNISSGVSGDLGLMAQQAKEGETDATETEAPQAPVPEEYTSDEANNAFLTMLQQSH